MEIKKYFGIEGLIQGYNSGQSKSHRKQREIHQKQLSCGNTAELVAAIRAKAHQDQESKQLKFDFTVTEGGESSILQEEQVFAEEHDWKKTRYAGIFIYLISLIQKWDWLHLVTRYFGGSYKIFMVFILMAAANVGSIEQLKRADARNPRLKAEGKNSGLWPA